MTCWIKFGVGKDRKWHVSETRDPATRCLCQKNVGLLLVRSRFDKREDPLEDFDHHGGAESQSELTCCSKLALLSREGEHSPHSNGESVEKQSGGSDQIEERTGWPTLDNCGGYGASRLHTSPSALQEATTSRAKIRLFRSP